MCKINFFYQLTKPDPKVISMGTPVVQITSFSLSAPY